MSRKLGSYDQVSRMRDLRDRGWCAFEDAFESRECAKMESVLRSFVDGLEPTRLQGFGATIFALAAREPKMRAYFRGVNILPFVEQALGGPISMRRTGARISGLTSQPRIVWHHHHGWDADTLARRTSFERLLFICYLEGTDAEHGPLIVRPRAFSDPFEDAPADRFAALPDEVRLEYPPGTIVLMDAPVLHSALRGTGNDLRVIWGAHCQSRSLDRAHPEDDPGFEKLRVGARHKSFRWGLRDSRRWLQRANRSALPTTSSY